MSRHSVWRPWTDTDMITDELILADILGVGPASFGLAVDSPELTFTAITNAVATHRGCSRHRAAEDAFEIWLGYAGHDLGPLAGSKQRANYSIGIALAAEWEPRP